MMQNVLRAMGGIENYGIISVCLFFLVFVVAMVFAAVQKQKFCNRMSALPLDSDDPTPASLEASHEQ
jgi:hypothetical protein